MTAVTRGIRSYKQKTLKHNSKYKRTDKNKLTGKKCKTTKEQNVMPGCKKEF